MNAQVPAPPAVPAKWRVRVALTDGSPETRQLLALWTTSTGVHAAVAGGRLHSSYHVDGRRHVTGDPVRDAYKRRLYPPVFIRKKTAHPDLEGVEELHAVRLRNEPLHFGKESAFPPLSNRPWPVWLLDSRTLTPNAMHEIRVGVVGTGGRAALDRHIAEITRDGMWILVQSEMGAQPSRAPYLIVLRASDERVQGAPGWATSSDAATLSDGQPFSLHLPPEIRKQLGPPREPVVWPPVPCDHSALVTYEYLPDSEPSAPFVEIPAIGMRLLVSWHEPGDPSRFELFVNPKLYKVDPQGNMTYRVPPMGPAAAYRGLRYGSAGNAEVTYVSEDGRTFYIRCRNLEWRRDGEREVSKYHLEVQW